MSEDLKPTKEEVEKSLESRYALSMAQIDYQWKIHKINEAKYQEQIRGLKSKIGNLEYERDHPKKGFHALIGKTIQKILTNKDKSRISIVTTETHNFYTEAECCSYSWIEHLNGTNVVGGIVSEIKENTFEAEDRREDQEWVQVYKYIIKTNKGDLDIEMRNESNGYYGGSLEPCEALVGTLEETVDF